MNIFLFNSRVATTLDRRRERVFMLLAGLFIGTLGLINILGVSRMVDFSFTIGDFTVPMLLPLGVLPYPVTFLCADLISEFYGKERATLLIWMGLLVNIWIFVILWLAAFLPPHVELNPITHLPAPTHPDFAFFQIRIFTLASVVASMLAYLGAQLLDVYLFQLCKQWTKGKHLWLRYNASMLLSQLVDTSIVISIAYYFTNAMPHSPAGYWTDLCTLIGSCYLFKVMVAIIDTGPFYAAVYGLKCYFSEISNDATIDATTLKNPALH